MTRENHAIVLRTLALLLVSAGVLVGGCAGRGQKEVDLPSPGIDAGRFEEGKEHFARGEVAQKAGKLDNALEHYTRSAQVLPEFWPTYNNMGLIYIERGDYQRAITLLRTAADRSGRDPRPLENLGLAYARADWTQKAYTTYREALERDNRSLPALRGLVKTGSQLRATDEQSAIYFRNALLIETDSRWRDAFQKELLRIETALRDELEEEFGLGS